jgi:ubiquinone/menaquinone biosynthesis C-methylase UbiE
MRPQAFYKSVFHQLVHDFNPRSVLDVGCGSGRWVRELRAQDINATGIDTSPYAHATNPFVKTGRASELPVEDQSFDLVCSEFSAHHFRDLAGHLREACRVATRGIAILDPWYDDTIPSQRSARALDEWMKSIDRAAGESHHDCYSAQAFLAAMPDDVAFTPQFIHLLKPDPIPEEKLDEMIDHHRKKAQSDEAQAALPAVLEQIDRDGISQDGAIIFIARF